MFQLSSNKSVNVLVLSLVLISFPVVAATAQQSFSRRHHLIRSDMAPGVAAETKRLANPELTYHTQPVRLMVPTDARIEIAAEGAFVPTHASRVTVGMTIGPVYRFKVTSIPNHFGKELYPSVEILDRLNPPEGLDQQFPVEVLLTEDDLQQAIEGRMVTKVIYLENPETALHHRHQDGQQPFFDVGRTEDPLRAAERMGRPMAILRIGSRVPTHMPDDTGFDFYSPTPVMLADPQPVSSHHQWDQLDQMDQLDRVEPMKMPQRDLGTVPYLQYGRATGMPSEILDSQAPAPHFPPIVPGEMNQMPPGFRR